LKISYGITVHNESDELNRLLEILIHKTDKEDEIVICVDGDDDGVRFVFEIVEPQNLYLMFSDTL
jgi:glycosyltransferase involved in cell wall biosynthesis